MARNRNIGSVISGTILESDLIPAFVAELKYQRPLKRQHGKLVREVEARMYDDGYYDGNDSTDDLQELYDALNEYAPAYFYFGGHPGDPADCGYWLSESFIEDFDGLKVDDVCEVPRDYAGEVLHVNDHGNMTLYYRGRNRRLYEVWSIV